MNSRILIGLVILIGILSVAIMYMSGVLVLPLKPSSPKAQKTTSVLPTSTKQNSSVNAVTVYKGYHAVLLHPEELAKLFDSWGVFATGTKYKNSKDEIVYGFYRGVLLGVHEAPAPKDKLIFGNDTYVYYGNPGTLEIDFYFTPEQIQASNISESVFLNFLAGVYKVSHANVKDQDVVTEVSKAYAALKIKNSTYFTLTKQ